MNDHTCTMYILKQLLNLVLITAIVLKKNYSKAQGESHTQRTAPLDLLLQGIHQVLNCEEKLYIVSTYFALKAKSSCSFCLA